MAGRRLPAKVWDWIYYLALAGVITAVVAQAMNEHDPKAFRKAVLRLLRHEAI